MYRIIKKILKYPRLTQDYPKKKVDWTNLKNNHDTLAEKGKL